MSAYLCRFMNLRNLNQPRGMGTLQRELSSQLAGRVLQVSPAASTNMVVRAGLSLVVAAADYLMFNGVIKPEVSPDPRPSPKISVRETPVRIPFSEASSSSQSEMRSENKHTVRRSLQKENDEEEAKWSYSCFSDK